MQKTFTNTLVRWKDAGKIIGEVLHGEHVPLGLLIASTKGNYRIYQFSQLAVSEASRMGLPLHHLANDDSQAAAPRFLALHLIGEETLSLAVEKLAGQSSFTEYFETYPQKSEARFHTEYPVQVPDLPEALQFLSLPAELQQQGITSFLERLFEQNPNIPAQALRRVFRAIWGRNPNPKLFQRLSQNHPTQYGKSAPLTQWAAPIPESFTSVAERNDFICRTYLQNPGISLAVFSGALNEKFGVSLTRSRLQKVLNGAGIDTSRGKKKNSGTKG